MRWWSTTCRREPWWWARRRALWRLAGIPPAARPDATVTPVPLLDNRFTRRFGERRREARLQAEATQEFPGTSEELWAEIERLSAANREHPELETERRILRLRHLAGLRLLGGNGALPEFPEPDAARLPEADGLPEIAAADV